MNASTPQFRHVTGAEAERANRRDWDAEADAYQDEHGAFLTDVGFIWGPEGLDEALVGLLGDTSGKRVLEVGSGAGQCSRWLQTQGASAVGLDLSFRQLQHSRRIDDDTSVRVPVVCAAVSAIPFADESFDLVCSAFGALPFVVDIDGALREMARVVRPGGSVAFSVTHPVRWMLPDDPTKGGLTVVRSYFDRTAYVELDDGGAVTYAEPHHTLGDWVAAIAGAGLTLDRLLEPEWPAGHDRVWGGWGPERGALVPGTAIFTAHLPPQ